ncbi:MAG: ABC transporter ATP-binding protein [Clostridiales bacterium]|jgi:ABC-2 type transport system ATP-binding protein|nr:ABC transporter ATP-binding protein [Clostridiales bacterium]
MSNRNAIEVKGLQKSYNEFKLDVSFSVPQGLVCGFIGRNGAGKTTTMKALLGMTIPDSGEAAILGKPYTDVSVKEEIGVLLDRPYFQEDWTALEVEKMLKPFYRAWSTELWEKYLDTFGLPKRQRFKTFSRGMKMKLGLSAALAHDAKLLLLDEPTGGLDPVVREEILDLMREYMLEESRTIFFSTHITSDLEKIADRVIFISGGKIIFDEEKDALRDKYCLVRGNRYDTLMPLDKIGGLPSGTLTERPSLDDIVVYFERGKVQ